jgi:hypothetical protein
MEEIMSTLSERAMLVTLHISAWGGMAFDKEVSEEVNESFKADKTEAGRYNKRLVAKNFLTSVSAAHSALKKSHKLYTLPWEDDGTRILSTVSYTRYHKEMLEGKRRVEGEVKKFVEGLPEYIKEAKIRLGDMFNEEDYPTEQELKKKFKVDIEVNKVPEAKDFRAKLSEDATKAIIKDIEQRCDGRLNRAMNDIFERTLEKVGLLKDKLRSYQPAKDGQKSNGVIRDSLVYNINEFAQMLPLLNIMGDSRIDDLQKQLIDELVEHSPEILRTDTKVRQQVLSKADALLKKVKGYMT